MTILKKANNMQTFHSIEKLLKEWGNWSNAGLGLTLNAPSQFTPVDIDDETALAVDAAIAQLGQSSEKIKTIVMLHYRTELSYLHLGRKVGLGETKTRQLLLSGVSWLEGHLSAKGILILKAA